MTELMMWLGVLCYAGALTLLVRHALAATTPPGHLVRLALFAGLLLHAGVLRHDMFTPLGIDYDVFNVVSFTAALMLLISGMLSLFRPVLFLNCLALPIAIGGLLIGHGLYQTGHQIAVHRAALDVHIVLSLSAYAVLLMATVHASLMGLQDRELKNRQRHRLWVRLLPSLQTMQRLLFELLALGVALLTVALAVGLATVEDFFGQHLIHKTVFSLLSWAIYVTLLIGHWRLGWRGLKAVRFTLLAFALLAIGFVGSKFVLEIILHRA